MKIVWAILAALATIAIWLGLRLLIQWLTRD